MTTHYQAYLTYCANGKVEIYYLCLSSEVSKSINLSLTLQWLH